MRASERARTWVGQSFVVYLKVGVSWWEENCRMPVSEVTMCTVLAGAAVSRRNPPMNFHYIMHSCTFTGLNIICSSVVWIFMITEARADKGLPLLNFLYFACSNCWFSILDKIACYYKLINISLFFSPSFSPLLSSPPFSSLLFSSQQKNSHLPRKIFHIRFFYAFHLT